MAKAMTPWEQLAEPFPDSEIKQRPGPGGMSFSYVDARAVMQRLDDILTPEGWSFRCTPGNGIVRGSLSLFVGDRELVREDIGYPNGPDDMEPYKSAASDALKRCAVHFGVGRHLYTDVGHQAPRQQNVAQRGPSAVVGDGSWSCPIHGTDKVRDKGKGQFCAGKMPDGSWCNEREGSRQPVQPRPQTNEGMNQLPGAPEEPAGLMDDLPF